MQSDFCFVHQRKHRKQEGVKAWWCYGRPCSLSRREAAAFKEHWERLLPRKIPLAVITLYLNFSCRFFKSFSFLAYSLDYLVNTSRNTPLVTSYLHFYKNHFVRSLYKSRLLKRAGQRVNKVDRVNMCVFVCVCMFVCFEGSLEKEKKTIIY